jgi:hypothetical protein
VSKKIKKSRKPRKSEKNNWKNRTVKKNRLKFWKNRPIRFDFGFISLKLKKLNRTQTEKNRKKTEPNRKKTELNRAKPIWIGFCPKKPNQTETGRFESVSVRFQFFFKKIFWFGYFVLIKTEPNQKWSPLLTTTCLFAVDVIKLVDFEFINTLGEIATNPRYMPHFKVRCILFIVGTINLIV